MSYEMLNHDNQRSTSANGEIITSFRHNHTNTGRIQRQPSTGFVQPRNRGQAQHCSSFCHRTPEVSHNCHHNILITNPNCHKACTFRYTPNTSAGEFNNHYHLADRRTLQPEAIINHLPCSNQQKQHHNAITSTEYLKPIPIETRLLTSVVVEQPNIQAAISPVETFNGNKSKFEFWITSVENAAQILGQKMLYTAFSKMVGSTLMSAHRLRDHLLHLTWDSLKNKVLRLYSTVPFDNHATHAFAHLQ